MHDLTKRSFHSFKLPTGEVLKPVTWSIRHKESGQSNHQCVPLLPVTVNDAIADLPSFDWVNPFNEIRPGPKDLDEIGLRLAKGIRRFDAVPSLEPRLAGFTDPVPYAHPPMSRYQLWIRQGAGAEVTHHYTRLFPARIVERVVRVPLTPNANHEGLPAKLRVGRLFESSGDARKRYDRVYGRIDGDHIFQTALTTVAPNSKVGRVLHPNQKRILTVRECARAQGFPDKYEFHSVNTKLSDRVADQHRQIGNAVPVPLGLALGKELGKALMLYWDQQDVNVSERSLSPEV